MSTSTRKTRKRTYVITYDANKKTKISKIENKKLNQTLDKETLNKTIKKTKNIDEPNKPKLNNNNNNNNNNRINRKIIIEGYYADFKKKSFIKTQILAFLYLKVCNICKI